VPNALPKRCFDAKSVLAGFDFAAMTEAKIDPLFDAWKVLPDCASLATICAISLI
jgi:hypothetical protein